MIAGLLFGFLPLAIWLYLLLGRRGFWLLRERDTAPVAEPLHWPAVVAVVPARNEADVIQQSIGSLLAQDMDAKEAARLGVCLHAEAADSAAEEQGERGLLASDLIGHLQGLVNP